MKTHVERLQMVRDAIDEILLTGQSAAYEGRQLTMANLDALRRLEKEYAQKAALEINPKAGRNRIIYVAPQ